MGYECSLHLIDEAWVRDVFLPGALAKGPTRDQLHRQLLEWFADGAFHPDEFLAQTEVALAGLADLGPEDVSEGLARTLLFGLGIAAGYARPVYQAQGFSFSFFEEHGLGEFLDAVGSAGVLLRDAAGAPLSCLPPGLVAAEPPRAFLGNYTAGGYLPAAGVPGLLSRLRADLPAVARKLSGAGGGLSELALLLGALSHAEREGLGLLEIADQTGPESLLPEELIRSGAGHYGQPVDQIIRDEVEAAFSAAGLEVAWPEPGEEDDLDVVDQLEALKEDVAAALTDGEEFTPEGSLEHLALAEVLAERGDVREALDHFVAAVGDEELCDDLDVGLLYSAGCCAARAAASGAENAEQLRQMALAFLIDDRSLHLAHIEGIDEALAEGRPDDVAEAIREMRAALVEHLRFAHREDEQLEGLRGSTEFEAIYAEE